MEELKLYNFPDFNKINIPKANTTKNSKKTNFQISMLLPKEEFNNTNNTNNTKENQFYVNKTNFFKKNNIKYDKYNKTDIKFPILNIKRNNVGVKRNNNLYNTVNNKKERLYKSDYNNAFNRIFQEFQMYNKKYNDVTKYFKFFVKTGNNSTKMNYNRFHNNFKHISCLSKPKSRKYCYNAFQRIKSIQ